jgi:2-polyprenyl-6-hydroxyphenyl methylase/3-demethylubiquinone-9 3-methyltransferase
MSQLNVDPQEIAKFEALAAKWWDQHSEFRPLHQINPLRLNWIDERVGGLAGKKVLDVGCGGGILAESMARRGADVLGIDMGEAPLAVGRLHAQQDNVQTLNIVRFQLSNSRRTSRSIRCCDLYGNDGTRSRSSIYRQSLPNISKPGGHVFFSTINRNPKSYLFAIIGAEYVLTFTAKRHA